MSDVSAEVVAVPFVAANTRAESAAAVAAIIRDVDAHNTFAAYTRAARALKATPDGLTPVRVSLLSSYTINPFIPYLTVEMAREGFAADIQVGAFHSVLQELLDPNSATAKHQPDVVIVAQLLDDLSPSLSHEFLAADATSRAESQSMLTGTLMDAMRSFRSRSACTFLVHNFAQFESPLLGLAETNVSDSRAASIRALNDALSTAARELSDTFVIDFDHVSATVGYGRSRDNRSWYLGRAPLSAALSPALAREHAVVVRTLKSAPRKCLVLDLDNTLWGGIVGEDGVAGIQIGEGYPGNVFLDFQRAVLQLHQRGALLALNSKNNEADALEVFASRPEMLLSYHHFATTRVNWLDKATNMQSIADELNIGVESLVFFDDNPIERERMRQALPSVLTLDVPADPMLYAKLLQQERPFERLYFTDEDRRRSDIQQQQKVRQEVRASSASLEEFLTGLEMRVSIQDIDAADVPRAVDLLRKTNQFNTTTRRHSASDLDVMLNDANVGGFTLRASDRFGDHGLVGLALARVDEAVATIDSFLLSCRVIGRGVESALLVQVARWAQERGATTLIGEFIPTEKNAPAANLFSDHGFVRSMTVDNRSHWMLDLTGMMPLWPVHIEQQLKKTPATASVERESAHFAPLASAGAE